MKKSRIKYYLTLLLIWTLLIASLVFFEIYKIQEETDNVAKTEARANFNKDQAIRLWAASHGGVYVEIDSVTQPNPELSHIPERDIETPLGKRLTLMNPAYMIRQLNEYFAEYYGIVGHITSKKLLRSENKPDEWELNALNQFEKGIKEVSGYSDIKGESYLRLMQPMYIKQSCLKCHAHQGYRVGDIRGGISISIPMKSILQRAAQHKKQSVFIFAIIWFFGTVGLTVGFRKLDRSLQKQEQAEKNLKNQNKELKEAKNLIGINEKRLIEAQKIAHLGHWELDLMKNKLIWSDEVYHIFGQNPDEHEASYEAFLERVHPEDRAAVDTAYSESVNKGHNGYEIEHRIIRNNNGAIRYVYEKCEHEKDNSGSIIRSLGLIHDITERIQAEEALRESEEKLNTLFEAMTDMVALHEVVCDDTGKIINCRLIDCNKSFTNTLTIQKEAIIGKLATEVYHADHAPALEVFSKVATTGKSTQYPTYDPAMDKHFMVSMVSPKKGQFATVSTDITVIKQFQEILATKNKVLENYLYIASHDLRSPLVNMQGFSQLLKGHMDSIQNLLRDVPLDQKIKEQIDQIINEKTPQALNFILGAVSKMDSLIKGLLQLSRTGNVAMNIQQIDMKKLIEEVVRVHSFQINEIKGNIEINSLPDCYGDKDLLNQLFSNIISNAIKYRNNSRSLDILVSAEIKYNKIIYCIEDNGIGIEPRHLEKIWDIFFQVNPKLSDSGEGIGLSVVRQIVDKHKGKVRVESEDGKGTRFNIELQKNEFSV